MRYVTKQISIILDGAYSKPKPIHYPRQSSKPKPKYYSQGGVVNLNLYILYGVVNLAYIL